MSETVGYEVPLLFCEDAFRHNTHFYAPDPYRPHETALCRGFETKAMSNYVVLAQRPLTEESCGDTHRHDPHIGLVITGPSGTQRLRAFHCPGRLSAKALLEGLRSDLREYASGLESAGDAWGHSRKERDRAESCYAQAGAVREYAKRVSEILELEELR